MKCVARHTAVAVVLLLLSTAGVVRSESQPKQQHDDVDDHEVGGQGFNNGSFDEDIDSMSLRAKVPSTTDCIKMCKNAEDCYCKALSTAAKPKEVYSYVTRWCTKDGLCSYCAKYEERCGFGKEGAEPDQGYISCCDVEGSPKANTKHKGQGVDCFYAPGGNKYACLTPCHGKRQISCTDKNGYKTGGYISCKGKRESTWIECQGVPGALPQPKECGVPGATCDDKLKCCDFYKCDSGKCKKKD